MASPGLGLSGLQRHFKVPFEDCRKISAKQVVPACVLTILAGLLQTIRPSLLKQDLFADTLVFNLAIFGKNEGDFRKLCFKRNYNIPLWILDSSAVHYLLSFVFHL